MSKHTYFYKLLEEQPSYETARESTISVLNSQIKYYTENTNLKKNMLIILL